MTNFLRIQKYLLLGALKIIFLLLIISSCYNNEFSDIPERANGFKPIYISELGDTIKSEEPRTFQDLGKIVYREPYIFINERYRGIHVIDNTIPTNPVQVAFWTIPGNLDFTISGDYLYAENSLDLLVIDISDIFNIKLENIIPDFKDNQNTGSDFPEDHFGYFECVDPDRGAVSHWIQADLVRPKCYTD